IPVDRVERSGCVAWSPAETATINGWQLSRNGGFTRRLNSATAIGHADTSLTTRDAIQDWLADHGAPLTIRVTPLLDSDTLARCEETWGLISLDETVVMSIEPGGGSAVAGIDLVDPLDDAFVSELLALNGRTPDMQPQWDAVVARIMPHATGLWVPGEGVGFVAINDGIAWVFSVAVHSELRRRGLATRLMATANSWASARSAEMVFLQVLGTNRAAGELYEKLGYVEAYRYSYLQPRSSS
ncbi:MAG: GNAT family N-acetyltransferase, partial [Actinomycetia bacterium]|nr:GNAT family N-acetyltransferase [Actinomycetes bacterium]